MIELDCVWDDEPDTLSVDVSDAVCDTLEVVDWLRDPDSVTLDVIDCVVVALELGVQLTLGLCVKELD